MVNKDSKKKQKEELQQQIEESLMRESGQTLATATENQLFMAVCSNIRNEIMQKANIARQLEGEQQPKKLYYLSVEFLQGRALSNNLINIGKTELYREVLEENGVSLNHVEDEEPDPGLGNGGLGRLASCFLDSLATLDYRAVGCGIRYEYGLFRQLILNGQQIEVPDDWLDQNNGTYPWEILLNEEAVDVHFGGKIVESWDDSGRHAVHENYEVVRAVPYEIPIVGYDTDNVVMLRLWRAVSPKRLDMDYFSQGDYQRANEKKNSAEVISKVLYPCENHREGKSLRLKQHYFFTSATVQYIVSDFKKTYGTNWSLFSEKVTIQINDTHPALAIPEMMRIFIDEENISWDEAWNIVSSVFNYTNHTVMVEALERWPEDLFSEILPRIYTIVKRINEDYCTKLWEYFPGQWERIGKMSIVGYSEVRMANLCVAACSHINGVSTLHAEILRNDLFRDPFIAAPWKYLGITNGVTPRRWIMDANPGLSHLIDESIGSGWRKDLMQLENLAPYADDASFTKQFDQVKQGNKERLSKWLKEKQDVTINPHTIFDVQAKRLHEYKRQLLNALHIIDLYDKLMADPNYDLEPTTFFFGAKASAGYHIAKLIIRLINALSATIAAAPAHVREKINVVFIENYNVSAAEILIPATDVSEQISTAGKEASGTGNMKFMMNGALTIGTLDGANVEISQAVGMENIYIFGKRAEEVAAIEAEKSYSAGQLYSSNPDIRRVLDYLINGKLGGAHPETFNDLYQILLFGENNGMADNYLVLLDGDDYAKTQARVNRDYRDRGSWLRKTVLNVAHSGVFSSDRTIEEYNSKIWHLQKIRF